MPSLDRIKPISYFKANAAEMLRELRETGQPYVLTQNGEAAAVLMDAKEYDKLRDQLVMLQILKISEQQYLAGLGRPLEGLKERLDKHHARRKKK